MAKKQNKIISGLTWFLRLIVEILAFVDSLFCTYFAFCRNYTKQSKKVKVNRNGKGFRNPPKLKINNIIKSSITDLEYHIDHIPWYIRIIPTILISIPIFIIAFT